MKSNWSWRGNAASSCASTAPHEAREDTVLVPALDDVVSKQEYGALGEDFEKKEHALFGKEGFEGIVGQVGVIEQGLGIFDLRQLTPK